MYTARRCVELVPLERIYRCELVIFVYLNVVHAAGVFNGHLTCEHDLYIGERKMRSINDYNVFGK